VPCKPGMLGCKLLCLHRELVMEYRSERAAQELRCEVATGFSASATEREEVRAFYRDPGVAACEPNEEPVTFKNWLRQSRCELDPEWEIDGKFGVESEEG